MKNAIGLMEFKSIVVGIEAVDEMLKAADVELVSATPTCPGKYVAIISGNVGAVGNSMKVGNLIGGTSIVDEFIINNVHEKVIPALSATNEPPEIRAIAAIETISAISSIHAADVAVKAANVDLIEIRIARGLGGKGYFVFTGEASAIKSAVNSVKNALGDDGSIIAVTTIFSPHKELIKTLL